MALAPVRPFRAWDFGDHVGVRGPIVGARRVHDHGEGVGEGAGALRHQTRADPRMTLAALALVLFALGRLLEEWPPD